MIGKVAFDAQLLASLLLLTSLLLLASLLMLLGPHDVPVAQAFVVDSAITIIIAVAGNPIVANIPSANGVSTGSCVPAVVGPLMFQLSPVLLPTLLLLMFFMPLTTTLESLLCLESLLLLPALLLLMSLLVFLMFHVSLLLISALLLLVSLLLWALCCCC